MRSKGQVAVEFLMYAGLFMLVVMGVYILTTFTEVGEISYRQSQLFNSFGYTFGSAPTVAYKGGTNFTYDIAIPKQLDGKPYNVTYICNDKFEGTTFVARDCYVQVAWQGAYQAYVYPYTIAPAYYTRGDDQDCLDELSGMAGAAV